MGRAPWHEPSSGHNSLILQRIEELLIFPRSSSTNPGSGTDGSISPTHGSNFPGLTKIAHTQYCLTLQTSQHLARLSNTRLCTDCSSGSIPRSIIHPSASRLLHADYFFFGSGWVFVVLMLAEDELFWRLCTVVTCQRTVPHRWADRPQHFRTMIYPTVPVWPIWPWGFQYLLLRGFINIKGLFTWELFFLFLLQVDATRFSHPCHLSHVIQFFKGLT